MYTLDELRAIGQQTSDLAYKRECALALKFRQAASFGQDTTDEPLSLVKSRGHDYYDYYPFLFVSEFPSVADSQARSLAMAGRLYLDYLLASDRFLDGEERKPELSERAYNILRAGYLHEKAVLLFVELFPAESPFWTYLEQYHKEYVEAIFTERSEYWGTLRPYRHESFVRLAQGKVAISKIIPTGLALLAAQEEKLPPLLLSHGHVALGVQLNDDLQDWEKDFKSERWSFVLTRLMESLGWTERIARGDRPTSDEVGLRLHFSGFADQILHEIDAHYQAALDVLGDLAYPEWRRMIRSLRAQNVKLSTDLRDLRDRAIMKRARQRLSAPHHLQNGNVIERVDHARQTGMAYVLACQLPDGHWSDWAIRCGAAREFATAYVGRRLQEVERHGLGNAALHSAIERASTWLLPKQQARGGWGWHSEIAPDAETTGNAIMFFAQVTSLPIETLRLGVNYLRRQVDPDGGVSTYHLEDIARELAVGNPWYPQIPPEQFAGWVTQDACITAIAAYALQLADRQGQADILASMRAYIQRMQSSEGYWEAYWWCGPMFSTEACIEALAGHVQAASACERARRWLLAAQDAEGSWSQQADNTKLPVSTALGLSALLNTGLAEAQGAVERAAEWLCARQREDGSWDGAALMRVPDPWITPEMEGQQWVGTATDQERLFTTATAVAALAKFQSSARAQSEP